MKEIWNIFINGYGGYANYLWQEITNPSWHNYFYALLTVSLFFFVLEWFSPWRKDQPKFRKDFWLDFFYMFFNFFLFSLIIYNAASDVLVNLFNEGILSLSNFDLQASNPMRYWPMWAILFIGFLVRDFVQWWTHRLLHKVSFLWEFHKVHHSVQEMGFAAHLRYHWMETIVYRTIEYLPLALLGIGLHDFFIIHIFTLAIGHYNHSNITVDGKITGAILLGGIAILINVSAFDINTMAQALIWQKALLFIIFIGFGYFIFGRFMKHIFNHPEMHIWHHAKDLPKDRHTGVNFGLSLAIWDFLFGTAYIPHNGKDIDLGFPGIEKFPRTFWALTKHGFK